MLGRRPDDIRDEAADILPRRLPRRVTLVSPASTVNPESRRSINQYSTISIAVRDVVADADPNIQSRGNIVNYFDSFLQHNLNVVIPEGKYYQ